VQSMAKLLTFIFVLIATFSSASATRSFMDTPLITAPHAENNKSFIAKQSVPPSARTKKTDSRKDDKIRYRHVYKLFDPAEWEFFESLPQAQRAEIAERVIRSRSRTIIRKKNAAATSKAYEYIHNKYYTESGQEIIPIFGGKAVIPAKESTIDAPPVTVNGQVIFPGRVKVQESPAKIIDLKDFREIITTDKTEVGNPSKVVDGVNFDK